MNGGAISIQSIKLLNLVNNTFLENVGAKGGAIYVKILDRFILENTYMRNNTAISFGGCLFLDQIS